MPAGGDVVAAAAQRVSDPTTGRGRGYNWTPRRDSSSMFYSAVADTRLGFVCQQQGRDLVPSWNLELNWTWTQPVAATVLAAKRCSSSSLALAPR